VQKVVEPTLDELKKQLEDLRVLYASEKGTLNLALQTLTRKVERK